MLSVHQTPLGLAIYYDATAVVKVKILWEKPILEFGPPFPSHPQTKELFFAIAISFCYKKRDSNREQKSPFC